MRIPQVDVPPFYLNAKCLRQQEALWKAFIIRRIQTAKQRLWASVPISPVDANHPYSRISIPSVSSRGAFRAT
ncbi:MAG: hypothetical protein V8Q43_01590 [Christensenellaceae bacterium]